MEHSSSGKTTWYNDNSGSFYNENGGSVDSSTGEFTQFDALSQVTIYTYGKGYSADRSFIGQLQSHVYQNGKFYQGFRDRRASQGMDEFQDGLDWLGTVPFFGEPVDLVNASISGLRGNYGNASLSLAAMVPVAGWGATAFKQIQRHHIIPRAVFRDASKALQDVISLNGGLNLKKLPSGFHGNHPEYSKYVRSELNQIQNITEGSIKALQKDLNSLINQAYDNYKATGQNLNDYFRNLNGN
ncbi:AHH domain-containing protein [Flavobacterium silvaticum]